MESKILKSLVVLGVPGVALGVFYLLLKNFNFKFDAIPPVLSAVIVIVFLLIVGGVTLFALHKWAPSKRVENEGQDAALHRLEGAWKDVNYIDCDNLIGPDVNKAANALEMTSIYWRNQYIDRKLITERYRDSFVELFDQLDGCNKQVPGYTKPKKFCKDFLKALVRETYKEIKNAAT